MLLTSLLIIALLLPLFLLFTPTTSNKLYFRHGPVSSAKTLNLLSVAHSYRSQNKTVLLLKPSLDTRFGNATIKSRSGLEKTADFMIEDTTDLLVDLQKPKELHCILVDEGTTR
ncbi:hypothetical protein TL16_g07517 [Triparma laevis f. inornata]|uniref:thymidine kinase n=1 Tax=Triparma laevis f. inornata TaxID=1714386 RepID=A0A9W7B1D1_9STRA|nr:hypothetical protein TL16_g07517 [Triparma laevis f. inornata]